MPQADSADSERTDKLIGQTLANRYHIEAKLGEGAMGTVFRARHIKVGRPFAVKVLHPRLVIDDKVLQRFEREAELAGRLRHPNVIGVVDVGETPDGLRYMVMDFAAGPDLGALLREGPMTAPRILHLVRQLLEGLFHAHEQGLIHRDFKPENVIVERDSHGNEVPRIVDFGIAILREGGDSSAGPGRLTTNGLVLGTPHYMAPEQAVADPIDHRIDLFALGIIVYEMLSGKLPFDGTGAEVARANLLLDPPSIADRVPGLDVDPLLEAFAKRLMAKKRDHRPPTGKAARDLLDLIERDRTAAAAVLGVTAVAGARTPKLTAPASMRQLSTDYPGTFPPPIRAMVQTEVADPLAYATETPPRTRRPWIAIAIAGAVVVVVVLVLVLRRGSSPRETPASGSNVALGSAVAPDAAVVAEAPPDAAVVAEAPPVAADAGVGKPITRPVTRPVTKPIVKPDPKPTTGIDVAGFAAQYKSVGAALKALEESKGADVASDLQARFRRIRFSTAVSTQATRDEASATLTKLRADIARLSR